MVVVAQLLRSRSSLDVLVNSKSDLLGIRVVIEWTGKNV
jgi:hypothetical protein